MNCFSMIFAFQ